MFNKNFMCLCRSAEKNNISDKYWMIQEVNLSKTYDKASLIKIEATKFNKSAFLLAMN